MLLYLFCNKSHYENVPFEIPESWAWCRLLDVCHIFGRIGFRGYTKEDLVHSGGAITLSPSNIVNGRMSYDNCTYISWDKYKESPEIQISNNDILLVKTGSSYGKCALVTDLPQAATINPQFVVLKYISYNAALLRYVLQSNYARSNYERFVLGTAIPTFTQVVLGDMLIPLPPANEQIKIIKEIDRWFAIIDEIESGTIELESYVKQTKSKILDLAISGKLVPQDPDDKPAIEFLKRINPNFQPCDNSHYENLPENWCLAKVKDVFVINPRNKAEDNIIAGFIPMTLIDDGYSNTFSYVKRKWGSIKTGFTHFADGDVAVAKISPCLENRKSIVLRDLPNGIGAGTTELHVFRSSVVVPEYALYFFKSEYFISKCVGTFNGVVGQQRVGKNIIEEIQIPIPPINEQTKIVSTIETIFTQLNTITAEL